MTVGVLVLFGFLDILPNHLLALMLIAAWVVLGIAPVEVAASGFASSTWFLLLASMAIGAAVARSGLLYRGAIELVRHLPASHRIRCLTLGALGVVLSPGMPDPAGRVMLATPLAQDIAETLRYPERSQGSAGLALATYVGFGMMGPLFLTGSSGALIAYGLLPAEARAQIDWVHWFLAALPTCLILFVLDNGLRAHALPTGGAGRSARSDTGTPRTRAGATLTRRVERTASSLGCSWQGSRRSRCTASLPPGSRWRPWPCCSWSGRWMMPHCGMESISAFCSTSALS